MGGETDGGRAETLGALIVCCTSIKTLKKEEGEYAL